MSARVTRLVGDLARLIDHLLLSERVGEPVVRHRVDRADVSHPEAEAGPRQEVGRLAHRLHAARNTDVDVSGADRLAKIPIVRMPEAQTLLTVSEGTSRGIPALIWAWREGIIPARPAAPGRRRRPGPRRPSPRRGRAPPRSRAAQVGGIEGGEPAAHFPEGGPGGGEDDRLRHLRLSSGPADPRGGYPAALFVAAVQVGFPMLVDCHRVAFVRVEDRRQAAPRGRSATWSWCCCSRGRSRRSRRPGAPVWQACQGR